MVFTDQAVLAAAGGIEIAQENALEAPGAVAILADLFQHVLGAAVRIDWILLFRFRDRNLGGDAVRGAGGGEDEALDAGGLHGSQEDEGTGDVVHVVLEGVLDGLSHVDEGGKVNHGVKAALHQEGIHDGGVS